MASVSFLTRIIQNARPEADWLADETYQLSPNQSVEAYVFKEVQVDGETKQALFLRSKTNTTDGKRLFKELPYNDEYLMYMLQDNINTAVTDLTGEITNIKGDISNLTSSVTTISGSVATINGDITTINGNIDDINTDITDLKGRMDDAEGDISNLTSSVTTISGSITTINTNITKLESDLKDEIDQAITSTYKPMGSINNISALPAPSASNLGEVYNVNDSFTTTTDFLEGAGVTVPAGSNVAIVEDGTGTYKYDVIGSFVDLTNYYTKTEVNTYVQNAVDNIDTSAIEDDIDNLQGDVSNLTSGLTTAQSTANAAKTTADAAMPKAGGTFTGTVTLASTPATTSNDKTAATTEFVKTAISDKADSSTVTALQTSVNNKAPLASPALTGTPTAPTATAGTNTTQIATTAFVKTAVSSVESDVDNLESDVSNLTSGFNTLSGTVTTVQGTANSAKTTAEAALPKSGGTMTGTLTLNSTPAAGTSSKVAATTEFVANALANFSSGTEVVLSATQPTLKQGGIWLRQI